MDREDLPPTRTAPPVADRPIEERARPRTAVPAPAAHGAPHGEDVDGDWTGDERGAPDPFAIRAEDTEPYFGLQYIARLFKIAAMVVIVALTAEIVAGVALEGVSAILPLLAELIRGVVLAAILWGAGDLTLLLIDVGHDVRAARVLLGRLSARAAPEPVVRSEARPD